VNFRPFLVAHAETAKLIQPCEGTFYDPAPSPQPTTMFCISHCEPRQDLAPTQGTPNGFGIVGPIRQQTIWAGHAGLGEAGGHRAKVEPGLNRDS
jgi:hypothetical protein